MRELDVWLLDERVGTLSFNDGQLSFYYREDWINHSQAIALSCSLPLRVEAFDDIHTRPFFAGLLPEGKLRDLIAQQFHISKKNDFALLDQIGGECAGAITFTQASVVPATGEIENVRWLDDKELNDILNELPSRPMLAGKDGLRLSLAGAQDKLPIIYDGQRFGLPLGNKASTHILKPSISRLEDSVINEHFCLQLAQSLKLQAARATSHHIGNHQFLLVDRYDRQINKQGNINRIHQEDFCQALGIIPEMKYQNEGGPSLVDCFDLVRRVTRPNALQILRLLDYVIFNTMIGNHDAHAKNFSLLYLDKTPILAPLYDALSTAVYPDLTPKMAMKIGSKYKFSEVYPRHWDEFFETSGLAKAQCRKRLLELCHLLPEAARQLQSTDAYAESVLVKKIASLIEQRTNLTIKRFST